MLNEIIDKERQRLISRGLCQPEAGKRYKKRRETRSRDREVGTVLAY